MTNLPKQPRFANRLNIALVGMAMFVGMIWAYQAAGLMTGHEGVVLERRKTHAPEDRAWAERLSPMPLGGYQWAWLGFGYCHEPRGSWPPTTSSTTAPVRWEFESGYEFWSVQVPYWFLLALPLVALAARWPGHHRRMVHWRWTREGRCAKCGYDLRSSPERCPECGTAREGAPSS